jgi:hypothetical protein
MVTRRDKIAKTARSHGRDLRRLTTSFGGKEEKDEEMKKNK